MDHQKFRYVEGMGMAYNPQDDRFYEALRRLKEGGRFEELTTEDIATCENIN